MSTATLKILFLKKSKHANAQLAAEAQHRQHPEFYQTKKIPGFSNIYDSEGPVALSLGLIILRGQCVSGHVVRASFVSDTPPKCLDRWGLARRRTGEYLDLLKVNL